VEQGWGVLVARFAIWSRPSLWKGSDWDQRMALAITTSIILHNLCVEMKDPDFRADDIPPEIFDTDDFLAPGPLPGAVDLRQRLAMFIFSRWTINADGHAVRR
jgi:hypothetical protein